MYNNNGRINYMHKQANKEVVNTNTHLLVHTIARTSSNAHESSVLS